MCQNVNKMSSGCLGLQKPFMLYYYPKDEIFKPWCHVFLLNDRIMGSIFLERK